MIKITEELYGRCMEALRHARYCKGKWIDPCPVTYWESAIKRMKLAAMQSVTETLEQEDQT